MNDLMDELKELQKEIMQKAEKEALIKLTE
jgi:hypothetical protein